MAEALEEEGPAEEAEEGPAATRPVDGTADEDDDDDDDACCCCCAWAAADAEEEEE